MKEHELLRIKLLKTLLEWEEKWISDASGEINFNKEIVTNVSQIEDFANRKEKDQVKSNLSVIEVSEYLGVSTDCIYSMVREKQIPHVRVRRRILFHKNAIDSWIQGNTIK